MYSNPNTPLARLRPNEDLVIPHSSYVTGSMYSNPNTPLARLRPDVMPNRSTAVSISSLLNPAQEPEKSSALADGTDLPFKCSGVRMTSTQLEASFAELKLGLQDPQST